MAGTKLWRNTITGVGTYWERFRRSESSYTGGFARNEGYYLWSYLTQRAYDVPMGMDKGTWLSRPARGVVLTCAGPFRPCATDEIEVTQDGLGEPAVAEVTKDAEGDRKTQQDASWDEWGSTDGDRWAGVSDSWTPSR